jgi:hypothetical protein
LKVPRSVDAAFEAGFNSDGWRFCRVSVYGRDVSPLDISWMLFFDAKSGLFHVSYFGAI